MCYGDAKQPARKPAQEPKVFDAFSRVLVTGHFLAVFYKLFSDL